MARSTVIEMNHGTITEEVMARDNEKKEECMRAKDKFLEKEKRGVGRV